MRGGCKAAIAFGKWSVVIAGFFIVVGCRAAPAPNSGFLRHPELMAHNRRLPFDRSWTSPDFNPWSYNRILVAPIDLSHLMPLDWWEALNEFYLDPYHDQIRRNLDRFTRHEFQVVVDGDPRQHFVIVHQPQPGTLILELSLIQIVPSKAILNMLTLPFYEANLVEFIAPIIADSEDAGQGVIAIEGRLRDAETGKVMFMFADRQRPPFSVFNLQSFLWLTPERAIIRFWAHALIDMLDAPPTTRIQPAPNIVIFIF